MKEEGVIKFSCQRKQTKIDAFEAFEELNHWRQLFYDKGLIGENNEGIGYGNISARSTGDQFYISGSATGGNKTLCPDHYALVKTFDLEKNSLVCEGEINASSESMSHGTLYRINDNIKAVVHIHHLRMWKYYLDKLPTTRPNVPYGTPEMALEIRRLYKESDLPNTKIMVMGGHEEGLISFGNGLKEAGEVMLGYYGDFLKLKKET